MFSKHSITPLLSTSNIESNKKRRGGRGGKGEGEGREGRGEEVPVGCLLILFFSMTRDRILCL